MKTKPYSQMTPREHIIETVYSRIKCGRAANNVHEAIEGYVFGAGGAVQRYYESASYEAIDRLIKTIERRIS